MALVFLFVISGIYRLVRLFNGDISIAILIGLVLSFFFVSLIVLFYFALFKTYKYRNEIVVKRIKDLIEKGHNKIMAVYDQAHISSRNPDNVLYSILFKMTKNKSLEDIFEREGIHTKIISVKFA